jgi:hypothetical protein
MSEDEDDKGLEPTPTLEEMLRTVRPEEDEDSHLQERYEEKFTGLSIKGQREYAHVLGLQSHYAHKRKWSWFLMAVMAFMIGFQSYLLLKVGTRAWDFTEYNWLLPLLLVQNLAQIIGLAVIVVKALFTNLDRQ